MAISSSSSRTVSMISIISRHIMASRSPETPIVPGVFKSLPSILSCLEDHKNIPEVAELLQLYSKEAGTSTSTRCPPSHPLIVFEGLDGAGKSLLTKLTTKKLNGIKASTPPDSIKHLRPKFDQAGVDKVLRRAFYSLGNYIAANQFRVALQKSPVIVDRYWHSTAAYAIAEQKDPDDIPEDVFIWPSDLLRPQLAIFLTVSENVRLERMSRRANFTAEEDQLKENAKYRNLLADTFLRMKSPSLRVVNCDGPADGVVREVLDLLEQETGVIVK